MTPVAEGNYGCFSCFPKNTWKVTVSPNHTSTDPFYFGRTFFSGKVSFRPLCYYQRCWGFDGNSLGLKFMGDDFHRSFVLDR